MYVTLWKFLIRVVSCTPDNERKEREYKTFALFEYSECLYNFIQS